MLIHDFLSKKTTNTKITVITCYDYPSAQMASASTIDCVLVGDSVSMVVHGHSDTTMATMDMMVMHTQAVKRGLTHPLLISDMPFLEHRMSQSHTVQQAQRLIQAGAQAIKIEGGDMHTCETIAYLVTIGIPILGHIGLTPQFVHQLGYSVQGKTETDQQSLLDQAKRLEAAGCSAIVLECIPQMLAKTITDSLHIPTIGIGAGKYTDGQVLVWHDMLGLQTDIKPKFLKYFGNAKLQMVEAINTYADEVRTSVYPCMEYSY